MKYKKSVYQSLVMITQFSIHMLVPVFLCTFLGIWLDKWLDTGFFVIILFFMGALAGFRNIYICAKEIFDKPDNREKDDRDV